MTNNIKRQNMKKNILWLLALLFPFVLGSCSEDDIVFDHEQPMFEIQEGKILLEVILPSTTTTDEEVYIAGDFNGGEDAAVGNDTWKLVRTEKSTIKRGIYLDPPPSSTAKHWQTDSTSCPTRNATR